jgi:histidine phosphotransferase ChpT
MEPTSMTQSMRLAELTAARLCHDLAGPINTLDGVLELAGEDLATAAELMDEARQAAAVLTGRLKLMRAAWAGAGAPMSVAELAAYGEGLQTRRLRLEMAELTGADFPPDAARLLLNVLLLAAGCLPLGGTVALSGSADQGVIATIEGPRAAWPPGFAALLADRDHAWKSIASTNARDLQPPITALIAHETGLRLSLLLSAQAHDAPPLLLDLKPR